MKTGMRSTGRVAAGLGAPAAPLRLRRGDIDLWRVDLDEPSAADVAELRTLLAPQEEERASRFYFDRDRRHFIVARATLRQLLGRYLERAPQDVALRYGRHGKPEVDDPADDTLRFNIAHSDGLALFGVSRAGDIGVDLERVRELPDWEFIAATCFSAPAKAMLGQAEPGETPATFFAAWTRQEARLKASGLGLGGIDRDARPVDERARPAPTDAKHYTDGDRPAFGPAGAFQIISVNLAPRYAAAVAVSAAARWATCTGWNRGVGRGPVRRGPRVPLEFPRQSTLEFL